MADNALDTNALDIRSRELSSTEVLDLFDDTITADPKKVMPIKKEPETKEKTKKPTDSFDEGFKTTPSFLDDWDPEDEENKEEIESTKGASKPETVTKDALETQEKEGEEEETEEEEEEEENVFPTYAQELLSMGIFTQDDDEDPVIEGPQDFAERWAYEARKAATSHIDRFLQSRGQEATDWFDAVFNKGVSPKEYMQQYDSIQDFSTLDLASEGNQERVVREALREQGLDPEDIDAEVLKLKHIGELEGTSQRYHKALIKRQSAKLQKMKDDADAAQRQKASDRETYRIGLTQLLNVKLKAKEFDGIPVTPTIANEVFGDLYNYKYTSPSGEYMTQFDKDILDLRSNPELKLKVGLLLNILKKDPTLAALKKKAVSKENNELFKELAQKKKTLLKSKIPVEENGNKYW